MSRSFCLILALLLPGQVLAADVEKGGKMFRQFCAGCHGRDGRGAAQTFMPHIDNLTKKGYIDLLPDEHLIQVIAHGGPSVGKSSYMPAWESKLSQEQIADIVAYIRTLQLY